MAVFLISLKEGTPSWPTFHQGGGDGSQGFCVPFWSVGLWRPRALEETGVALFQEFRARAPFSKGRLGRTGLSCLQLSSFSCFQGHCWGGGGRACSSCPLNPSDEMSEEPGRRTDLLRVEVGRRRPLSSRKERPGAVGEGHCELRSERSMARQLLAAASLISPTPSKGIRLPPLPPPHSAPSSGGMAVPLKRGTEGTSWRFWVTRWMDPLWEGVGGALTWGRDLGLRWS